MSAWRVGRRLTRVTGLSNMWDLLVEPVVRIFGLVWLEDERKGARWFAVGCLALVLIGIGVLAWIYS